MMNKALYRKYNDGSHNSSKYHKLDGTPIRAILKRESEEIISESLDKTPEAVIIISGDKNEKTKLA